MLNEHQPPLSDLVKRVVLLVARVPKRIYTTYNGPLAQYRGFWEMASTLKMARAVANNQCRLNTYHRVLA